MTIPGVDRVVARAIKAAVGDSARFASPRKFVSYLGLNPSVRQSGSGPTCHGRITKQGRGHARGPCLSRQPGRQRVRQARCGRSSSRVRARRGQHVAAVATERKLAVIIWHLLTKGESCVWSRLALHATKLRDLELKAGQRRERGQKGLTHAYNIRRLRDEERRWMEQAEGAYARLVAGWNLRGPRARTDAANQERR
jgi:transposase